MKLILLLKNGSHNRPFINLPVIILCPGAFWEVCAYIFPLHVTLSQGNSCQHKRPCSGLWINSSGFPSYTTLHTIKIYFHSDRFANTLDCSALRLRAACCGAGGIVPIRFLICRLQEVQESTGFCGNKLRWKMIPETFGMILSCCTKQKRLFLHSGAFFWK